MDNAQIIFLGLVLSSSFFTCIIVSKWTTYRRLPAVNLKRQKKFNNMIYLRNLEKWKRYTIQINHGYDINAKVIWNKEWTNLTDKSPDR